MTHQPRSGRGVFEERWTWLGAVLLAVFFLTTSMYIGWPGLGTNANEWRFDGWFGSLITAAGTCSEKA